MVRLYVLVVERSARDLEWSHHIVDEGLHGDLLVAEDLIHFSSALVPHVVDCGEVVAELGADERQVSGRGIGAADAHLVLIQHKVEDVLEEFGWELLDWGEVDGQLFHPHGWVLVEAL